MALRVQTNTLARHLQRSIASTKRSMTGQKPPLPPFSYDDAVQKVRMAEDAWNSRDPDRIKMAYTADTVWRNRSQFLNGRDEVAAFLTDKFATENGYRLIKEIWAHSDNRIAVRFCYEFHNPEGQWFRAHGNENWEFTEAGLMKFRHASINDVPIEESERKFHVSLNGCWQCVFCRDHCCGCCVFKMEISHCLPVLCSGIAVAQGLRIILD